MNLLPPFERLNTGHWPVFNDQAGSMMQVNRLDALTIAVSENRFSQIATRTILTETR